MTSKYKGISTNMKLIRIFQELRDKSLVLKPKFQRNLVWNNSHKERFIETILLELPFPEVYFCDGDVNLDSQKSIRFVVDGQQRLSTIYKYIKGELSCKKILPFEKLTKEEKENFFNYIVIVRDLGTLEEKLVKEIFNRINSVQYALNATEIRNALYEGEFIETAKKISSNKSLEKLQIFRDSQISRMKDIELILLIMTTIEINGYFTRDEEVEGIIKEFDNEYLNKTQMKKNMIEVFNLLVKVKLPNDSIWFRTSNFFTLTTELLKYKIENNKLMSVGLLSNRLLKLTKLMENNKNKNIENNKFAKYYYFVYQATASKKARIFRGELVSVYLK